MKPPLVLEIEPTNYCNLKCKMCHVRFMSVEQVEMIDIKSLESVAASTNNTVIQFGAVFEPSIHKQFAQLIRMFSKNGNKILITTNATMLNDDLIKTLEESNNIYSIDFSVDSAVEDTYEKIRVGGKFKKVSNNIRKIVKALEGKNVYFGINAVLMKSNIDELIELIDFAEDIGINGLGLIYMVLRNLSAQDLIDDSLYPIQDYAESKIDEAVEYVIANSLRVVLTSAYLQKTKLKQKYPDNINSNYVLSGNIESKLYKNIRVDLQKGKYPGMDINCTSPWTFAKIMWNGNVQLCYKENIGNIVESSFENIWIGESAEKFRKDVLETKGPCQTCDYYKFCISAASIDTDSKKSFFSGNLLNKADEIFSDN
ncbi:Radical SAM domain protein [Arcobacter nitrofigilis DSM 7299]|uniref:Radical SAM domain protein n=1 Tax=Arcobacter nitrofigilis (strain ATCC 33309 / DSM 7299 / CCUG 15893 / LMG 7604 / NCTC 12251 / CI) TaxID=572480 RepID=D5V7H2_ARCNC|nr:radical SAM protein [Arcobacter nitrofigilis]ADG94592.1 Radical SAM domain protein [Arcobacter nitrofigilis DSM 7299]